jgi:hypothetical protein
MTVAARAGATYWHSDSLRERVVIVTVATSARWWRFCSVTTPPTSPPKPSASTAAPVASANESP